MLQPDSIDSEKSRLTACVREQALLSIWEEKHYFRLKNRVMKKDKVKKCDNENHRFYKSDYHYFPGFYIVNGYIS